ncbi:hypothetical protein HDV03_000987 [Kappamyces sp. JEL0829]|nr:hypothetical protein HDV03_000987 [Kappamyces sp. JEL0829]
MKSGAPTSNSCPVCKSGTSMEQVIPIYVRGRENKDPRQDPELDERPQGHRTTVPPLRQGFSFFGLDPGQGYQAGGFTFNVGVFPFFPFGIQLNSSTNTGQQNVNEGGDNEWSAAVSRLFMMVATLILVSIILY